MTIFHNREVQLQQNKHATLRIKKRSNQAQQKIGSKLTAIILQDHLLKP
jgi:hypothetical protein